MLYRRKKKPQHDARGRFVKRKRSAARRRLANPRHHNWGRIRAHKRRVNPTVILANPHRRRRLSRRRHPDRVRHRGHRRHHGRRLLNPTRMSFQMWSYTKVGLAGGLGIIAARLIGGQYTKYLSATVLGDAPSETRKFINEVVRLVVMGAGSMLLGEAVVRRINQQYATVFTIGAMAETGRQLVGVVAKKAKPDLDANAWGLGAANGRQLPGGATTNYDEMRIDSRGVVYGRRGKQWYRVGTSTGELGRVVDEDEFGRVVDEDEFGDDGEEEDEGA